MLHVAVPPGYEAERRYIIDVVLRDFLGQQYRVLTEDRSDITIKQSDSADGRELRIADVLFQSPEAEWTTHASMPQTPLDKWTVPAWLCTESRLLSDCLPVIYGHRLENGDYYDESPAGVELGLDLFGSSFFMLSRYEECVMSERDYRNRFAAGHALATREGFLQRPIVNEYTEVFRYLLTRLWPSLVFPEREYALTLSHDVDWPFLHGGKGLLRTARTIVGDALRRQNPGLAFRRALAYPLNLLGYHDFDPCNTFDWIMDLSDRKGVKSTFNFIAGHTGPEAIDGIYSLDDSWIRALMQRIHRRGHLVGLHPSYNTYRDSARIAQEFRVLRSTASQLGIQQTTWGGRQHYLRWEAPTTWQAWEEAGLDYDSTVGFADSVGFRCGTCFDFPVFNIFTKQCLRLREVPLVLMDTTISSTEYLGLSAEESLAKCIEISQTCRRFGGLMTLLWHNSNLVDARDRRLYESILAWC